MFEKDAEEYRESKRHKSFRADVGTVQINYESYLNNLQSAFKEGAEFGYNKAKEEHKGKCKTAYIKGVRTMANALKDYDRTDGAWTDYFEHTVEEVLKRLLKEKE